jgi:hypothetical protein
MCIHNKKDFDCDVCKLEKSDPTFATIFNQAKKLLTAVKDRVIKGRDTTTEEYKQRMDICEGCDRRTENWTCKECGCFLTIKAKWSTEACPLGNWPAIVEKTNKNNGCGCNKNEEKPI